jgi:hypothetical protein
MGIKKAALLGGMCLGLFSTGVYAGTVIEQYKTPRGTWATVENEKIHKNRIAVTVNGKPVKSNTWYHDEEKTFVKLREVSELLGAEVNYNAKTMTAEISLNNSARPSREFTVENPAKINEVVRFKDKNEEFEVELLEYYEGEAAEELYNDDYFPKDGKKLIVAKFRYKYVDGAYEPFYTVGAAPIDVVSRDGVGYRTGRLYDMKPDIYAELYRGAEHEGWIACEVDADDQPYFVVKRTFENTAWFDPYKK